MLNFHPRLGAKGFSGQIDNTADKLIKWVWVNKGLDHTTLIDLPDANSRLGQTLATDKKQLISRMEIENRHQCFAVVTVGFKARVLHHPVNLVAQDWNAPRAIGVKLRSVEAHKAHFTAGLALAIKAFDHHIIRVDIPVHPGALRGLRHGEQLVAFIERANTGTKLFDPALTAIAAVFSQ